MLLALHGYPPESCGGTEHAVQALARGLLRAGHEVTVVAGSSRSGRSFHTTEEEDVDPASGKRIPVIRLHRGDGFVGHWQSSFAPAVGREFGALVRRLRPDVVHVHHWLRLSRDLVARAAEENVPAVVTLHDYWTTCLIYFRVPPAELAFCDAALGPEPCLPCAGYLPHDLAPAEAAASLANFKADVLRELRLARATFALCADQAGAVERYLGAGDGDLGIKVLPPARELALEPAAPPPSPAELGRLRIGSWGALHPLKGTDLLIDAVRRARNGPLPLELHVAGVEGDADFARRVRADARDLPVVFHGPFEEGQLAEHPAARVHAFASGSRARETWGLVLDEAVALRLPLLLPRFGAFPEHLGERGARYYEPGDAASLAALLRELQKAPDDVLALRDELPALDEVLPPLERHVAAVELAYSEAIRRGAPPGVAADAARERRSEAEMARLEDAMRTSARGTDSPAGPGGEG